MFMLMLILIFEKFQTKEGEGGDMRQPGARRRHPATGQREDPGPETFLVPLTVAMDSIRLWSDKDESAGKKREEEKSGETAQRGHVSTPIVGG